MPLPHTAASARGTQTARPRPLHPRAPCSVVPGIPGAAQQHRPAVPLSQGVPVLHAVPRNGRPVCRVDGGRGAGLRAGRAVLRPPGAARPLPAQAAGAGRWGAARKLAWVAAAAASREKRETCSEGSMVSMSSAAAVGNACLLPECPGSCQHASCSSCRASSQLMLPSSPLAFSLCHAASRHGGSSSSLCSALAGS